MKMRTKRLLAAILALVMALSLAACGGKDKPADETGSDQAETITLGKYTAVFKGYTLTKDEDGNDAMVLTYDYTNGSKEEQSFAWAFLFEAKQAGEDLGSPMFDENNNQITRNYEEKVQKGQTLEVSVALTLVNTTDDVTIHFSDFDDHEYTQTIKLSGSGGKEAGSAETVSAGTSDGSKPESGNEGGGTQTVSQDYWSGDWYGWWYVPSADGYWEELENGWSDCCARIEKYDASSGYIEIWDESGSGADEYMAECAVSFGAGITENGGMMSEDGSFWDCAIKHADWIVDPGASAVSQYDHMICIDGTYEDPENDGGFDYKICLRPWGMDWEDVAADDAEMLPYYYASWYLPAIQAGEAMPDVIGGDYGGPDVGEIPDSQTEGQSGEMYDPNASAVDGVWQELVYGDYGLSKASATGVVSMTLDQFVDRISFYADSQIDYALYDSLYNSVWYVHGKPLIDDPRWDTGKTHVYQWSIESGEYATLVFEVTDYSLGIEKLRVVETSPGLLDG